MDIEGVAKKDKITKKLINRLNLKDIAIISHRDLDEIAAISLMEKKVSCVINTEKTISGRYPNRGPEILLEKGIPIFEVKEGVSLDKIIEGETIRIIGDRITKNGEYIADCTYLEKEKIQRLLKQGHDNLESELDNFIENTLEYAKREKGLVTGDLLIPEIKTRISQRHVLVVVRGKDYKEDLMTIKSYINEVRPVLIGVDGGADALLEFGYIPDIIVGDMDSVSDKSLFISKEVIVHAYANGKAPGLERVKSLGIEPTLFQSPGTSEDVALLLSYEKGADLIVAVGTHTNMIDFLEKGRLGMASTFLVRLKVGDKLVDAKGVNKLYGSKLNPKYIIFIVIAAFVPIIILTLINPVTRELIKLIKIRFRLLF